MNVYFLSVVLAGYYLGKRPAVLGAFLCILTVGIYVALFPQEFLGTKTEMDLYLTIMTWSGFLILAGAAVGQLQEKLAQEVQATRLLNVNLQHQQAELQQANLSLRDSSKNLVTLNRSLQIQQEEVARFKEVAEQIKVPQDVVLPIEALDGSIGHSRTVAVLSYALAQALGLPEKEKKDLLLAGFLADIGKEIVPHYILNRGGSLSGSELDLIKLHTGEGVRLIKKMGYENEAVHQIVKHGHENFNGRGYPDGLQGEKIPIGSPHRGRGGCLRRAHVQAALPGRLGAPRRARSRSTSVSRKACSIPRSCRCSASSWSDASREA